MKTCDSVLYGFLLVAGWLLVALAALVVAGAVVHIANLPAAGGDLGTYVLVREIGVGIVGMVVLGSPGLLLLLLRRWGLKRLKRLTAKGLAAPSAGSAAPAQDGRGGVEADNHAG
jgi:hypothetical protein